MAYPTRLLDDGERVVVSARTHPKALVGPFLLHDGDRVRSGDGS